MCKITRLKFVIATLLILLISLLSIFSVSANPIPVYPDPKMDISSLTDQSTPPIDWILSIFIVDFFVDILIVYSGLYLLDRSNLIKNHDVMDFSKLTFLFAVAIISITGLLSEFFFGAWIGGLIIALFIIFLSFVFVSKYLLKIGLTNGYRIGFFAVIINISIWIIFFSV